MRRESGRAGAILDWFQSRINLTEIFSLLSVAGLFYTELDTRKPLQEALEEVRDRPLPSYARWPRVFGVLVLILFAYEALSGMMLAFFYLPGTGVAYESVLLITRDVQFGWFVRQTHFWGAQFLIVILMARLIRFYFRGLYRAPRELIWICGALLFLIATHLDFTGRLLSWNNEAYWASVRALDLLYALPLAGGIFEVLIGSGQGPDYPLIRFYFLHVAILPAVFWIALYFSFASIRRIGLSALPGEHARPGGEVYRAQLYSLAILVLLVFAVLVTFAVVWPAAAGSPVQLFETPAGTSAAWYLLAPYGFLEAFPAWVPVPVRGGILLALLVGVVLLPAVDLLVLRTESRRRMALAAGVAAVGLWAFFTVYGWMLDLRVG